jgi:hypothetical protein
MKPTYPEMASRRVRQLAALVCVPIGLAGCSGTAFSRWLDPSELRGALAPASVRVRGSLYVVNARPETPIVPAVVYLEPVKSGDDAASRRASRATLARVRHDGRGFAPEFHAIGPAEDLLLDNASGVHHEIFWLRGGTRYEVALPPAAGEAARVHLGGRGIVRFYCALHAEEHFSVFVAPTPYFALLGAPGPYAIDGVAPGDWKLAIWSETISGPIRDVSLARRGSAEQDIWIDARLAGHP